MSLLRQVAVALVRLGALVGLLSVVSLLPWYPLQLLEHFRLQLLAGCAAVTLAAALLRQRGWVDLAALCLLLDLVLVTPALSGAPAPGPADGVRVRLLLANVLTNNRDHAALGRAIAELRPDLVALVEPDRRWFAALSPALAGYSARRELEHPGNFGLGLYVRGEMTSSIELLGSELPTLVAHVTLSSAPAAPFAFVLTHPIPPIYRATERSHYSQLAAVARRVVELRAAAAPSGRAVPVILAGDLNTTPWSRAFASLREVTGLIDTRAGFGVHASFPADPAAALLRIPIDHVLVSPEIGVLDRRIERDIGSDHLPVLVELQLPRR
jgi:endonuclease/exonuclease/phosphatase (EEP) superfamily protein YafD